MIEYSEYSLPVVETTIIFTVIIHSSTRTPDSTVHTRTSLRSPHPSPSMMASKPKRHVEIDLMAILGDKRPKLNGDDIHQYKGFSFQTKDAKLEIPKEPATIDAKTMFQNYISKRRPCLLDGLPPTSASGKPLSIPATKDLVQCTGTVQVEKRTSQDETYGQNRTPARQVEMSVQEFVQALETPEGNLLYLSTQDTDEEGPFQTPCNELVQNGSMEATVPYSGNLVLYSANLWMGKSNRASSSGLHHDYHDNFYLLLQGTKRFRLFSPDCAPNMYTHGDLDCIHENGRISYVGSETRADGVPLDDDDDDDDEEEVVLGNGFDYKSDGEDDDDDDDFEENNEKDDFDDMVGKDNGDDEEEERPNSFSRIDLSKSDNDTSFPLFKNCREATVELKAGQCLYLPAGWFHEVTSFGGDKTTGRTHMALNYWYHPPDALDNYESPYKYRYWKDLASK